MGDLSSTWVLGAVFGVLLLFFLFFLFGREKYPYFSRKTLLTPTELKFYKTLLGICDQRHPDLGIAMQVRLADIITCSEADWQRGYGPRISAKHLDFVLFEKKTTKTALCIELDDHSHHKPDRRRRDQFVNKAMLAAKVPLIRVSTDDMNDKKLIEELIKSNLS
ncbi:MAG: DUF2726 domain-containing protein [Bdellovibrionales bacterium]